MSPRTLVAAVPPLLVAAFLLGCGGSDLTSPERGGLEAAAPPGACSPWPQCKNDGGAGGDPEGESSANASVELTGGLTTSAAQPVNLKTSGRSATLDSQYDVPIPIAISGQIPSSGGVNWGDCIWNTDVGDWASGEGLVDAQALWDTVLGFGAEMERHYSAYIDLKSNGETDWDHRMRAHWFTWTGPDQTGTKYMWEVVAGADRDLSLVQPVGSWDGTVMTVEDGVIEVRRTDCGVDASSTGCNPARGKGNRPAVACRNDGPAFAPVTFVATVQ